MAIDLAPFGDGVFTTGVTPVEVVNAPAAGTTSAILMVRYRNTDTVAHGYSLELVVGADRYELEGAAAGSIEPGAGAYLVTRDRIVILGDDTSSLEFSLLEATVTNEGEVTFASLDRTVS